MRMTFANAEAAVRLRQTGAPVSSIFALSPIITWDDDETTVQRAARLDERLWAPGIGLYRDGVLRVHGRQPVERADLAGAFDLIGFSYYSALGLATGQVGRPPGGCAAVAARLRHLAPTASASCSTASTPSCLAPRCSSPSSASAPTTTRSGPRTSIGR